MSQEPKAQPPAEQQNPPVSSQPAPQAEGGEAGQGQGEGDKAEEAPRDEMSAQQKEAYDKMMNTLTKMNNKIQKVKQKISAQQIFEKKAKTDEMSDKIITSKQSSQIITKQNLLSDITQTYEKVVIGVYSQNSKLKKKIDEMAEIIKDQNKKIYEHAQKEIQLVKENQQLKADMMRAKDERMVAGRGAPQRHHQETTSSAKKKINSPENTAQNEDFDFWSMPQNDYGKKKKDFVQDSSLWVNQKDSDSPFVTEQRESNVRRKR